MVTKDKYLAALPTRKASCCHVKLCGGRARLVCFSCMERGCKHQISQGGYFDVPTGEDLGNQSFSQIRAGGDRLVGMGVCGSCKSHGRRTTREDGIARMKAALGAAAWKGLNFRQRSVLAEWSDKYRGGGHSAAGTQTALVRRGLFERADDHQYTDGYTVFNLTPEGDAALAYGEALPEEQHWLEPRRILKKNPMTTARRKLHSESIEDVLLEREASGWDNIEYEPGSYALPDPVFTLTLPDYSVGEGRTSEAAERQIETRIRHFFARKIRPTAQRVLPGVRLPKPPGMPPKVRVSGVVWLGDDSGIMSPAVELTFQNEVTESDIQWLDLLDREAETFGQYARLRNPGARPTTAAALVSKLRF